MGDRANVAFKTKSDSTSHVWLYLHWGGSDLPGQLLSAMKTPQAQKRLLDESYLCRILIDRLIREHTGETGYGISTSIGDNEYPVIEVDIPAQVIRVRPFDRDEWEVMWDSAPLFEESFELFCRRDSFEWEIVPR